MKRGPRAGAIIVVMIALGAFAVLLPEPSFAAGPSVSLTKLSSGNIVFNVTDVDSSRLVATTNPAFAFAVSASTSTLGGTITVISPTITGTGGNAIPLGAFWASCTSFWDPAGMFSSLGVVQLSSHPVTCATLASKQDGTVLFSLNLFLDDTSDATGFPADAYALSSPPLTVTANAP